MAQKIQIFDTTLRDGEQTNSVSFSVIEKLTLAQILLQEVKVDRIEVASARVSEGEFEAVKNKPMALLDYVSTGSKDTRSGFGVGILELGKTNPNVVALCADLAGSLKLDAFIKEFPDYSIIFLFFFIFSAFNLRFYFVFYYLYYFCCFFSASFITTFNIFARFP